MGQVVLYAFDTMADWEYAYITTVLQMEARGGDDRYHLVVAGAGTEPVTTLGGLRVLPETTLDDLDESDVDLLLLPGGNTWLDGEHSAALALAGRLLDSDRQVAGICGATRALARAGLLEHRAHVVDADADEPDYPGRSARVHASIAHDGPLITAIGEAPLEFSRAVFMALDLDDQAGIDGWYASFKGVPDAR